MNCNPRLQGPAQVLGPITAGGEFVREFVGNGFACRVSAKGTGGADAEIQVYGSSKDSDDPLDWYPLGQPMVFTADGTQTVYVDEPNTYIIARADVYVAGSYDIELQRLG